MSELNNARIPSMNSFGDISIAQLAAQMLRLAKTGFTFDVAGSSERVKYQAGGLGWEGSLLKNLECLAQLSNLELTIDEESKTVRLIKRTDDETYHLFE